MVTGGLLQEKLFGIDPDVQLDHVWIFRTFAADDHAQRRCVERAVGGLMEGIRDHLFRIGPIRRRVVARAVTQPHAFPLGTEF